MQSMGNNNIRITHVNRKGIKKRKNLKLKKIALILLMAAGIILTKKIKDTFNYDPVQLVDILEDKNMIDLQATIQKYVDTCAAYEELMDKNHSELEEIELRMDLISQIRNLADVELEVAKQRIIEDSNLDPITANVFITRTGINPPETLIKVNTGDDYATYDNIPLEINAMMNSISGIEGYNGTGESSAWDEDAMNDFIKEGHEACKVIESIITSEKEFDFSPQVKKSR